MRYLSFLAMAACGDPSAFETALDTALPVERVATGSPSVLTIETDAGADGRIDRTMESTFDARGDRVLEREDRDGDGVFERVTAFTHHRVGDRVAQIDADLGADGSVDSVETRDFDAKGRIVRMGHDADADGRAERWEETVYAGRSHTVRRMGGPKVFATTYTNVVGADGALSAVEVDLDADGRAENRMARRYADGLLEAIATDSGIDGTVDSLTRYRYDAEDRLVEIWIDTGNDGAPETRIFRSYAGFDAPSLECLTR